MTRTRIVATVGPATESPEALRALRVAGMDVARLNGSHATLDWHAAAIATIRRTLPEVPILFDVPGRKIRTARLAREPVFAAGDTIVLTTAEDDAGGARVPVTSRDLHRDLVPGAVVFADDGTLRFTVTRIDGPDIHCRAETAGRLRSAKGINVPALRSRSDPVTERDRRMVAFARANGVDFIGVSFVESAAHVAAVRALIGGDWPRIVAKVENRPGLDNVDEVVAAGDAVMIDRGDLAVETGLEHSALMQKRILAAARRVGTPVIVATEMLHTMIDNPYPTKAEVSDITNAVLDGAAATMLSGETAVGRNPAAAVATMRRIAAAAEAHLQSSSDDAHRARLGSIPEAMGDAAALICRSLPITKIVAVTISGFAARAIAARAPRQPILAVGNDAMAARSFNLIAGTRGVHVDLPFARDSADHIVDCLEVLWRRGELAPDDMVLVTSLAYPRSGNRMNLMQTHVVGDLVAALGWEAAGAAALAEAG